MHKYWRHLGDYAKKTRHLSMLEHGAFTLLLDLAYDRERALPGEEKVLMRLLGVRSSAEKLAVGRVLEEFWVLAADGWVNKRVMEELIEYQGKSDKTRDAANKRWHGASNADADADALRAGCEGNASRARSNNQQPTTKNQQPSTEGAALPPGVDADGVLPEEISGENVGAAVGDTVIPGLMGLAKKRGGPEFPGDLPEGYRESLTEWWEYKRERREGYKSKGWEVLVRQQQRFPAKLVQASVEASMANNWAGLFTERVSEERSGLGREGSEKKRGGAGAMIEVTGVVRETGAPVGWDGAVVALYGERVPWAMLGEGQQAEVREWLGREGEPEPEAERGRETP